MLVKYNLHIHSGLSPCADNDLTPVMIVGTAALCGIDMIALTDHNAIENVQVAIKAGEAFGVCVVPGVELTTEEDIHMVCLFPTYEALRDFMAGIEYPPIENRPEIYGRQYVYDEEDNIVSECTRLLVVGGMIGEGNVRTRASHFGGIAIPAHIDRDYNSMLSILGSIPYEYPTVELSRRAGETIRREYEERFNVVRNTDAHTIDAIDGIAEIELEKIDPTTLIAALTKHKRRGKL